MATTKRELQEENEQLREKLEEAYDVIGEALGFDDDSDETDSEEEDGESDTSDLDDEE
ncbi:MAG: hypothetical protein HOP00_03415 [Nitrospira sp.]|nr:hypothetical protein [Nitrospira sp.]